MATTLPELSGGTSGAGTLKGRPFVPGQRGPEGLTVCPAHFNYLGGTPRGGALPSPWDEPSSQAVSSFNIQAWSPRFETVLGSFPSRPSFCGSFTFMDRPEVDSAGSCPEARPCVLAGEPVPAWWMAGPVPVCWPVQGQPKPSSLAPQPAPVHLCGLSPSALEGTRSLSRGSPIASSFLSSLARVLHTKRGLLGGDGKLRLGHLCP